MADLPQLWDIFAAARTRRWHTHPLLSATQDFLDGHQGRVARLILALHPDPSRELLAAALTHDDGEHAVGDIARPAKRRLARDHGVNLDEIERDHRATLWGTSAGLEGSTRFLGEEERIWLILADRLDGVMWARIHAPALLSRQKWQEEREEIEDLAVLLGCLTQVRAALEGDLHG